MTKTKLENFRFDEHYAGMLAFFAERFGTTKSEIVRRSLDYINIEYGMVLRWGELFIEALGLRYDPEARLEFRPKDKLSTYDVFVDGVLDKGLIGTIGGGTAEERIRGVERLALYLAPTTDSPYHKHGDGESLRLFIGYLDRNSPATLSIRLGDLTKVMAEFWGLVGRPQGPDAEPVVERRAFAATWAVDG